MSYWPYPAQGYYGYPVDSRSMYIYDGSYVYDPDHPDEIVKQLKKINKTLDSIDKKLKTIQENC